MFTPKLNLVRSTNAKVAQQVIRRFQTHPLVSNTSPVSYKNLTPGTAKEIDFKNLGFQLQPTRAMYLSIHNGDKFKEVTSSGLIPYQHFNVHPGAQVLHYAQTCFEGAKVECNSNGDINLFRIDKNAERMQATAKRLLLPEVSTDQFITAVAKTIDANKDYIPLHKQGFLYIRPVSVGLGPQLGVAPSPDTNVFYVMVSPMGNYFKSSGNAISLQVQREFHRAAPGGTGNVKYGGNYASAMLPAMLAKQKGHAEALYLDVTNTYIDEAGAANFGAVIKNGDSKEIVFADSNTILPSITRDSVAQIAKAHGFSVAQRQLSLEELKESALEAFVTGTAAGIVSVGAIEDMGKAHEFEKNGEITQFLIKALDDVKMGKSSAPNGQKWLISLDQALNIKNF